MIRKIGAALAGLGVVGVVVFALQSLGASFHPAPDGIPQPGTEAFAAYVAAMPPSWAFAFGSELLGAFLGALTAAWIARDHARLFSGAIIGFALLASVNNWITFEHPMWFVGGQLVGYPVVLMVAWTILGRRSPSTGAAEAS